MEKTVKKISKVKIIDQGLKGLHVSYMHPQEKDGMMWHNEHVEKRKHPIHSKLEGYVKELSNYLLDCCGYYNGSISVHEKDYLIAETRVTEIQVSGQDSFKILGEMRVRGDKYIKISTPSVDSLDEYEDFSAAMLVISKIIDETHEYMAGKVKFDNSQFLMNFAEKKHDDVLIQEFASMSNKEKMDRCSDILQKMGAIVIINEDMDIDDVDVQLTLTEEVPAAEIESPVVFNGVAGQDVPNVNPLVEDVIEIPMNMPEAEVIYINNDHANEQRNTEVTSLPAF